MKLQPADYVQIQDIYNKHFLVEKERSQLA